MKAGCPIWSNNSSSVIELIGSEYPFSFSPEIWILHALNAFNKMFDYKMRTNSYFNWDWIVQVYLVGKNVVLNETLEVFKKLTINEK